MLRGTSSGSGPSEAWKTAQAGRHRARRSVARVGMARLSELDVEPEDPVQARALEVRHAGIAVVEHDAVQAGRLGPPPRALDVLHVAGRPAVVRVVRLGAGLRVVVVVVRIAGR